MRIKRIFFFLILISTMVAASSINLDRASRQLFDRFQRLESAGKQARAEVGYCYLAQKLPYTAAGFKAMRKILKEHDRPEKFILRGIWDSIERTSVFEWLILVSFFLVVTVFLYSNILPWIVFVPFLISAGGLFHLSYPLITINNSSFEKFLLVNPYVYTTLTLLIFVGFMLKKWAVARDDILKSRKEKDSLSMGEELLFRQRQAEKLEKIRNALIGVNDKISSSLGRHFVNETGRLLGSLNRDIDSGCKLLDNTLMQYRDQIKLNEEIIAGALDELNEIMVLRKQNVIKRKELKEKKHEEENRIRKCREEIELLKQKIAQAQKIRTGFAMAIGTRDAFEGYLCESFQDMDKSPVNVDLEDLMKRLWKTNDLAKKLKLLNKNTNKISKKLDRLEGSKKDISELIYNKKKSPLSAEKKQLDDERQNIISQINKIHDKTSRELSEVNRFNEIISGELNDLRILKKIKGCFRDRVKALLDEAPEKIKIYRGARKTLQEIQQVYSAIELS